MLFFAIFALLTTALTVVNSGTDVERLWDADIVAERYRAPKIIIAVVTMITTAIVLPVRYYPLSALLGIFCLFDETANMTRCSGKKYRKGKNGKEKNVSKREKFEGKKLGRWDGWCAAIGNNGRRVFRAFASSLDIPTNECLDQLRDGRGEPTRLWNRRWHSIRSHVRLGKKFYYDGSITVGLSEWFSRDDERN